MILRQYGTPDKILRGHKKAMVEKLDDALGSIMQRIHQLITFKFVGTQIHMSKRGSRIARRAIFAVALASICTKRNGEGISPYLREYS